jgi:hypothetical protein
MQDIKELAIKRYEICSSCPKKTDLLKVERCKECGCIILLKIIVPSFKCPLGKW